MDGSLIKILDPSGRSAVGAGLLMGSSRMITCSHVVNLALGLEIDNANAPATGSKIKMQFDVAPGITFDAEFIDPRDWTPPPTSKINGKDLCTLHILGDIPPAAIRAKVSFAPITNFPRKFRTRGFPPNWSEGDTAEGYVVSRQGNAAYLLRPSDPFMATVAAAVTGLFLRRPAGLIHKGFSGGPVEVDGKVIGLVSRSRKKFMDVTAYATPFQRDRPQRPARNAPIEPRTWFAAAGNDMRRRSTESLVSEWRSANTADPLILVDHFDSDLDEMIEGLLAGPLVDWDSFDVLPNTGAEGVLGDELIVALRGKRFADLAAYTSSGKGDYIPGIVVDSPGAQVVLIASRQALRLEHVLALTGRSSWSFLASPLYERKSVEESDEMIFPARAHSPTVGRIAKAPPPVRVTMRVALESFANRAFAESLLEPAIRAELALIAALAERPGSSFARPAVRRARASAKGVAEFFSDACDFERFGTKAELVGGTGVGKSHVLREIERRLLFEPSKSPSSDFAMPPWIPLYLELGSGGDGCGQSEAGITEGGLLTALKQSIRIQIGTRAGGQVQASALRRLLAEADCLSDFTSYLSSPVMFLINLLSPDLLERAKSFIAEIERDLPSAGYLVTRHAAWSLPLSSTALELVAPTLRTVRDLVGRDLAFIKSCLAADTDAHTVLTNWSLLELLQECKQRGETLDPLQIDTVHQVMAELDRQLDEVERAEQGVKTRLMRWLRTIPGRESDAGAEAELSDLAVRIGKAESIRNSSGCSWIRELLAARTFAGIGQTAWLSVLKPRKDTNALTPEALALAVRMLAERDALALLTAIGEVDYTLHYEILHKLPRQLARRLVEAGCSDGLVPVTELGQLEPVGSERRARLSVISNFDPRVELPPVTAPITAKDGSIQRFGVYPITRSQFEVFIRSGGYADSTNWQNKLFLSRAKEDELEAVHLWNLSTRGLGNAPMTGVSFPEANAFCSWLSNECGQHYCLPTSAEWVAAAGMQILKQEAYALNRQRDALPPGSLKKSTERSDGVFLSPVGFGEPNEHGCYDIYGLTWEWCDTWAAGEAIESPPSSAKGEMPWPVVVRGSPQGREVSIYDLLGVEMAPMQSHPKLGFRIQLRPKD